MQFHNILNKLRLNYSSFTEKFGVTVGPDTLDWTQSGSTNMIILIVFIECFANRVVIN